MDRLFNIISSDWLREPLAVSSVYINMQGATCIMMIVASIIVEIGTSNLYLIR